MVSRARVAPSHVVRLFNNIVVTRHGVFEFTSVIIMNRHPNILHTLRDHIAP